MNTAAPAPASNSHASASAAHAPNGKARHAATQESGTDLFANLLSLLSSTHEPATDLATGADTATDEKTDALAAQASATDGSQNPLAALLGWPVAPLLGSPGTDGDALPASSALPGTSDAFAPATATTTASNLALPGAAQASDTTRTPQPGVSLQGMVPLATPTAPDAATLAALAQAGTAGTGAPGDALSTPAPRPATAAVDVPPVGSDTPATPRHLHWRSTAGAGASVTTQALQTGPQNAPVGETGTRQALAAQTRSTVALDERFGQSLANQAPLAADDKAPVAAGAGGSAHQDSGSGSPGAAPGQSAPEPLADNTAPSSPEASAYAEATRDTDDASAAHWGTPSLRHASLRVGEGTEDAIDIQLSMAGQEVQVDFRTDNAEARASLAQDASGSLGELLQRSGIQLGSVSVGAQSQQHGGNGRAPEPTPTTLARGRPATGSEASTSPAPAPLVRPRSDGSRPLDLFV